MTASRNNSTIAELRNRIADIEGGFHWESPLSENEAVGVSEACQESATTLVDETEADKAYQQILRFLSYRDRSTSELARKLEEKEFSELAARDAIDKAVRLGLVDDERFARNTVEAAFRSGKGSRRAAMELSRKGFDGFFAQQMVESSAYSEADELQRALNELHKHPPRSKNVRDGAFRKLVGKGYPVSVAAQAAREYVEEVNAYQKA